MHGIYGRWVNAIRFYLSFNNIILQALFTSFSSEFLYIKFSSLDNIYKKNGPIPLEIVGKITIAVCLFKLF